MKIKIILLILVFGLGMTFPLVGNSQVLMSLIFGDKLNSEDNLFGIHLNESLNTISNFEPSQSTSSFNLGLFFSKRMNDKWMLNLEMLAKYRRGANEIPAYSLGDENLDQLFQNTSVTREINYLSLPLSARYFLGERFFLEAGPQISLRTGAKDIFESSEDKDILSYKKDIRDQVNRWDFGYLTGIGFMIGKDQVNTLGIRHHESWSDVLIEEPGKQTNSQWALFVNLPIGRGKMKSAEKE
ncbi:outer membrane protein with beta-barrel domain [Algoriphagus boseongensis]|uniref:Outer membrane protein with beta-barrel domain n=1 Tax=Algoriphagus boseongensis TaxID=1442587 RepID=A0A4R6T8T0_9BACT|nr:porin family protein [Algoriphagus boseongensis]TDQ19688.1 outer membrane protein with beta-barrel domain [Algoriphagus boseongensis]